MAWTEAVNKLCRVLADHRPSLYPMEEWDDLLDIRISKLSLESADPSGAAAVKAGLHLWNESLDMSHDLSQEIHNPTGSYWHGIMHRMEGDYSNAKYWFRQVGTYPIYAELLKQVRDFIDLFDVERIQSTTLRQQLDQLKSRTVWDASLFVDLIEHEITVAHDQQAEELLSELQWIEMKLLLQYSFQQSGGESLEL